MPINEDEWFIMPPYPTVGGLACDCPVCRLEAVETHTQEATAITPVQRGFDEMFERSIQTIFASYTTPIPEIITYPPSYTLPETETNMPTTAPLTVRQQEQLNEALEYLRADLNRFDRSRTFIIVEGSVKLDEYRITVTPQFERCPGTNGWYDPETINRVKLNIDVPQEFRSSNQRYAFYFKYSTDLTALNYKIQDAIMDWGDNLRDPLAPEPEELTEAELIIAETKIKERKHKMDELKEKAQKTYDRFMSLLAETGAKIESTQEDEIINVALPNNVKFRLNIYGEQVILRDIDLPVNFSAEKTEDFVSVFNKLNNI